MRFKYILLTIGGLSLLPLSAMAQSQEPGGLRFTLDVDQRFGAGTNPGLEVPSQEDYLLSNTRLVLGLSRETESQRIALNFGGSLRIGQSPPEIPTGFKSPLINFAYDRERANSTLSFGAGYEERDIAFLRAADFLDGDGKLDLPDDTDDLTGSGERKVSYFNVSLETGKNDPIGFILSADDRTTTYDNATSTSLDDYRRSSVTATTLLRFSDITTGKIALSHSSYDSDDTDRNNDSINFGFDHAVSAATRLAATLGYQETRTKELGTTTVEDGLIYNLALTRDMKNGTATVSLDSSRDYLGERLRARAIRSMALPEGSLSYSVGATSLNGENINFIGYLDWKKELPTGDFSLNLNQDATLNNEDDERLSTTAFMEYRYEITENTGWGLGALYSYSDYGDSGRIVERSNITAAYRYGVTPDLNLIVGVSYRLRDDSDDGQANSSSVFVNLSRKFEFLN